MATFLLIARRRKKQTQDLPFDTGLPPVSANPAYLAPFSSPESPNYEAVLSLGAVYATEETVTTLDDQKKWYTYTADIKGSTDPNAMYIPFEDLSYEIPV